MNTHTHTYTHTHTHLGRELKGFISNAGVGATTLEEFVFDLNHTGGQTKKKKKMKCNINVFKVSVVRLKSNLWLIGITMKTKH